MSNLFEKAKELGIEIQKSEEFINFIKNKKKIEENIEIKELNEDFNNKRELLNIEMAKDDPNSDVIQKFSEELREVYSNIHENEIMSKYNESKNVFDSLINELTITFTKSAYGEFSDDFLGGMGCAGSCSNCKGC